MSNFSGGFDFHGGRDQGRAGPTGMWTSSSGRQGDSGIGGSRTLIRDISPHQPNTVIIGIVVAKQSIFSFPDKKNPGSERSKFLFTLRDSPSDYVNVTCWGSEEYIKTTSDSFKICDVVEVQNCQVISKTGAEFEDKWNPWTPSQYQVNVSESHSIVNLYNGWDYTDFAALAHVPIRPPNDYYRLSDILASGQTLDGSHVNILAIVKHPGTPKQMTSRAGKPLTKCEARLMDESCASFSLFMWDPEMIDLAQTWTAKENIIFAVDVKVTFDSYRNCMVGTCNQRTVITTNPDCREAHQLYQFALTLETDTFSQDGYNGASHSDDLHSISQVYTVDQVKSNQVVKSQCGSSFSGIVFAYLTSLNIDEDTGNVICYRCTSCKFRVEEGVTQCQNRACPSVASNTFCSDLHYNLLISLSDYTDGIDGVRLSGQPATDLLQHSPQEFLSMSDDERVELKCNLLLEKFKVYVKSGTFLPQQRKPNVRVLSMTLADPEEAAEYLGP